MAEFFSSIYIYYTTLYRATPDAKCTNLCIHRKIELCNTLNVQKKYLFAIYKLGQNGGVVKSSEVAKMVGVTKASTAIMTERLAESRFIEKEHYGRIELTESGIKAENPIFTNCVIIRDFLENALGLDEKTADEDAVQLSVHASEKTLNRLSEYILGTR